ncbi:hypothetical protein BSKO_06135 [Bryopsis sp. KO-2023]|nr:hypothetical protein BSKO_06135 [Bryopsis sp. KO-2023]
MAAFQDEFSDDDNLGLGAEQGNDAMAVSPNPQEHEPQEEEPPSTTPPEEPSIKEEPQSGGPGSDGQPPTTTQAPKVEPTPTSPGNGPSIPSTSSDMLMGSKAGSAVYIANLQWWTTDADVERFCSGYGQVASVQFLAERSNGKSKGVALVEFADQQAAMLCKEGLSGNNIHGRTCVVTFPSQGSHRSSFGGRGGMGMGPYDRNGGRMMEGRGRGRGRGGYMGPGGWDMRPGMGMGPDMGYMHEMGMGDMGPMDMMGMPPMDRGMMHGMHGGMPHPFPMPGGGYHQNGFEQFHGDMYDQWECGMERDAWFGEDRMSQGEKRARTGM